MRSSAGFIGKGNPWTIEHRESEEGGSQPEIPFLAKGRDRKRRRRGAITERCVSPWQGVVPEGATNKQRGEDEISG